MSTLCYWRKRLKRIREAVTPRRADEDCIGATTTLLHRTWSASIVDRHSHVWRSVITVGMLLAGILLIPALVLLWTAWQKFSAPIPPEPWLLTATGLGALVVNVGCAFLLARFRHHSGSLTRAAFLSARNDALANIAIIAAGLLTIVWLSAWPDLIVGIGIAVMNADAAKEVWRAAREEHASAET